MNGFGIKEKRWHRGIKNNSNIEQRENYIKSKVLESIISNELQNCISDKFVL